MIFINRKELNREIAGTDNLMKTIRVNRGPLTEPELQELLDKLFSEYPRTSSEIDSTIQNLMYLKYGVLRTVVGDALRKNGIAAALAGHGATPADKTKFSYLFNAFMERVYSLVDVILQDSRITKKEFTYLTGMKKRVEERRRTTEWMEWLYEPTQKKILGLYFNVRSRPYTTQI